MDIKKTPWARIDAHVCCTCEYWGGERDLDFRNQKLMYIQVQYIPQGKCAGARPGVLMSYSNYGCSSYKKWHKLP